MSKLNYTDTMPPDVESHQYDTLCVHMYDSVYELAITCDIVVFVVTCIIIVHNIVRKSISVDIFVVIHYT